MSAFQTCFCRVYPVIQAFHRIVLATRGRLPYSADIGTTITPEMNMKASPTLQSSFQARTFNLVLGALLAAATVASLGLASTARNSASTPAIMTDGTVHTVVISAKRPSPEEKQAMAEQDVNVQTVILVAKRLTASEKSASLKQEQLAKPAANHLLALNSAVKIKEAAQLG
ncbi:hypothetical protein ACO0LO_06760 [Undibacterium sp. TJN25]|uniref:hypothetical protein n=1 Tax=Undibacterium sp. TJN25 TaxID=3413056 RepID=UPI003BEF5BDC